MKRICIVFVLILCIGFISLLFCYNQKTFMGSKTTCPGFYKIDIEKLNGKDFFTMELKEKDMIQIHFETQKGFLYLEIKNEHQIIYIGNGKNIKKFSISIPETGLYTIVVKGYQAKGILEIKK
ncbi:hypothetical protein [Floccifex sp.]|uniref:hypothetical protein n=1 Tax=Floccifex sp. TaxID=2815810 RepID=UPI003F11EF3E